MLPPEEENVPPADAVLRETGLLVKAPFVNPPVSGRYVDAPLVKELDVAKEVPGPRVNEEVVCAEATVANSINPTTNQHFLFPDMPQSWHGVQRFAISKSCKIPEDFPGFRPAMTRPTPVIHRDDQDWAKCC